jgi:hypothetical protein
VVIAMEFNREKFKALLHYVVWKAGDVDGFGAIKHLLMPSNSVNQSPTW